MQSVISSGGRSAQILYLSSNISLKICMHVKVFIQHFMQTEVLKVKFTLKISIYHSIHQTTGLISILCRMHFNVVSWVVSSVTMGHIL